ncbi:MAG: aminoacyl-tRNA hydrolase [SAR324 cluster bacterium]|nr:aminoacyl-tRNA hydrolase [SAR324 cluster bacterium]
MAIFIDNSLSIPDTEIQMDFIRSSGPGGQNVNKVNTAVQLRFDIGQNETLSEEIKHRLIKLSGYRVTEEGVLIIEAKRFRSQGKNRQDALDRLEALIRKALIPPKKRKKSSPGPAARKRRLEQKHQRAQIKKARRYDPDREME